MKILIKILVTVTTIFISTSAWSQGFDFGVKLGANYNKIKGMELTQGYMPGWHFGAFAEIGKNTFAFQPELLFSQIGTEISEDSSDVFQEGQNLKLKYLSIPLLVKFKLSEAWSLHAGPQFGVLINKNKNLAENGSQAFKGGDFAMDFGVQYSYGAFRLYARYCIGLSDVGDLDNQESWKNQVFQLGVGLKIF